MKKAPHSHIADMCSSFVLSKGTCRTILSCITWWDKESSLEIAESFLNLATGYVGDPPETYATQGSSFTIPANRQIVTCLADAIATVAPLANACCQLTARWAPPSGWSPAPSPRWPTPTMCNVPIWGSGLLLVDVQRLAGVHTFFIAHAFLCADHHVHPVSGEKAFCCYADPDSLFRLADNLATLAATAAPTTEVTHWIARPCPSWQLRRAA